MPPPRDAPSAIRPVRILHLSDPHFYGLSYNQQAADDFFEFLPEIEARPDLLVITGDFAFNGEATSFVAAAHFIQKVRDLLEIRDDKRVRVVPGNHDFRRPHFAFSPAFSLRAFREHLGKYYRENEMAHFPEFNLALWSLDSSAFSARERLFDLCATRWRKLLVDGKVGKRALRNLRKHFQGLRSAKSGAELVEARRLLRTFKIALLHHHPLPIPVVGERELGVLEDAGDLLRDLGECDFDMILHGHQHFPYLAQVKYFDYPRTRRRSSGDLLVTAAGTVTSKDVGHATCNHFSIITIDARNPASIPVEFNSYTNSFGAFGLDPPSKNLVVPRPGRNTMPSSDTLDFFQSSIGYVRERFGLDVKVTAGGGVVVRCTTRVRADLERLREVHIRLLAEVQVGTDVTFKQISKDCEFLRGSGPDRLNNYVVQFEPHLAQGGKAEFEIEYTLAPGTFFADQAALHAHRRQHHDPPFSDMLRNEDGLIIIVSVPTNQLEVHVDFTELNPTFVHPVVFRDNAGTLMSDETDRIKTVFESSGATGKFVIEQPIFGARYALLWTPPARVAA